LLKKFSKKFFFIKLFFIQKKNELKRKNQNVKNNFRKNRKTFIKHVKLIKINRNDDLTNQSDRSIELFAYSHSDCLIKS